MEERTFRVRLREKKPEPVEKKKPRRRKSAEDWARDHIS